MQKERIHGGNVYKTAKELNVSPDEILDFSANINPLGFPHSVEKIILEHIKDIAYYPDIDQSELKEAAAFYYGTAVSNIMPGNGSVELINIVFEVVEPKEVIIPSPTFLEYARICKNRRLKIRLLDLTANNFILDIELFNRIKNTINPNSLFIACNPNNPTGIIAKKSDLIVILEELKTRNSYLMMDEAFMDFVEENESMVDFIEQYDNLIVLKSATKFFAIPGLRLGFVIANPELMKTFYDLKDPWNINTFAGFVGKEIFKDEKYIQDTRSYISREKKRLWENISKIPNLEPMFPEANFIFVKTIGKVKVTVLAEKLKQKKILIRNCSNYDFLNDNFFRIAVKKSEENDILISTLNEILCINTEKEDNL